jgi:photosystem II stability/assembly factor-like uncharacterized protein
MATKDGGKTWTRMPIQLTGVKDLILRAVACSGVSSCDVAGITHEASCYQAGAILHTDDGGKTWVRQFGDCATSITALACPTARTCYAGGWYGSADAAGNQLVLRTDDGGASWDDQLEGPVDPAYTPGKSIPETVAGMACPATQVCFLTAGGHVLSTADGGATWGITTPAAGNVFLAGISCPTVRVCLSAGWIQPAQFGPGPPQYTGLILRTVDGGKTWTRL